jgi:hypothetical protein
VDTFISGRLTDICAYLLAIAPARQGQCLHLPGACRAGELRRHLRSAAGDRQQIGAMPHPGDLLHQVFLYHMALNGIEVVKEIY